MARRQQAHHRITWEYLSPTSPVGSSLQRFISGTPRADLPPDALRMIAELRFVPISETTIEGKHAKVSLERFKSLSPVRVSLANRLPLVEKRIKEDVGYLDELAGFFGVARIGKPCHIHRSTRLLVGGGKGVRTVGSMLD